MCDAFTTEAECKQQRDDIACDWNPPPCDGCDMLETKDECEAKSFCKFDEAQSACDYKDQGAATTALKAAFNENAETCSDMPEDGQCPSDFCFTEHNGKCEDKFGSGTGADAERAMFLQVETSLEVTSDDPDFCTNQQAAMETACKEAQASEFVEEVSCVVDCAAARRQLEESSTFNVKMTADITPKEGKAGEVESQMTSSTMTDALKTKVTASTGGTVGTVTAKAVDEVKDCDSDADCGDKRCLAATNADGEVNDKRCGEASDCGKKVDDGAITFVCETTADVTPAPAEAVSAAPAVDADTNDESGVAFTDAYTALVAVVALLLIFN